MRNALKTCRCNHRHFIMSNSVFKTVTIHDQSDDNIFAS